VKVVVTGGAGFIGANLCHVLASRSGVDRVVAIDDLTTGSASNLRGLDIELIEASILDRSALAYAFDGAAAVVHLAARPSVPRSVVDPVASHEANATGTVYVLEACRASGARLVAASSSSVYGNVAALPKEEDLPTRPQSPYAASKLATEAYVLAYGATYQIPTLAFRFFNVYGPLQAAGHAYAAVVPAFIDAALRGRPLPVDGDGRQTRDFTYVGSVVDVLAEATVRGICSTEPVNLAFGTRTSILDLIAQLNGLLGVSLPTTARQPRPGDVRDSQAANGRLRALFPDLAPVPLKVGLAQTLAWFRGLSEYAPPTTIPSDRQERPESIADRY
jgi:UDP-glucose 4-epimerase